MFCSCQHPDQQIILDKEKTFILNCYGDDQRPGKVNGSVVPENYFRAPNLKHSFHSFLYIFSFKCAAQGIEDSEFRNIWLYEYKYFSEIPVPPPWN